MENKISKKRIIFPAIHQEILSQLKEENKCNAYVKGYTTDGDKSKAGIKCHQPVLAMASPLLKAALETATDGSKQMCCCEQKASKKGDCFVFDGCIVLADASEDVIQSIIKFIYGKEVPQSRKLKDETMKWLDVLKINDYTHDLIMESSSILVEDELNEEVTLTTEENMLMRGGYRCIACKNAIFDHNKKKLYLDHLSEHKNAMLEQLKESTKDRNGFKEFSCVMCQQMMPGKSFSVHFRNCFLNMKKELAKLSTDPTERCEYDEPSPRCQIDAEKSTSAINHFLCSACNKSFRYKLALKKHVCSNKNSDGMTENNTSRVPQNYHGNGNTSQPVRRSHTDSSSEDESRNENMSLFGNEIGQSSAVSERLDDRNGERSLVIRKRSRGRPTSFARIPRLPILKKVVGSGDCPDCGESFPNKEILKLHTCKSYFGLETENTYREDRQNVELFGRSTQRRSLEESPPMSPKRRGMKKRRKHKNRNRQRNRSKSSPDTSASRGSTKSGDLEPELNLDSQVSTSEDDELKPSSTRYNNKNLETYPSSTKAPNKTVLSSIISEFQIQESSETDDNGSIITKAINSLENEMGKASTSLRCDNNVSKSVSDTTVASNMSDLSRKALPTPRFPLITPSSQRYSKDTPNNLSSHQLPVSVCNLYNDKDKESVQIEKSKKEVLCCEQCGKPFPNQSLLTDHILEEHDSDPFG